MLRWYSAPVSDATAHDYEYRGLVASTWDLLRGDCSAWPDRPFYRAVIERAGQPALDVGCGTGRLILDYLAAGLDVDGVDNSPEMLALCREKAAALGLAPKLYEQPMESLALPRRYATIFVPSSSFQLLTDDATTRAALQRFIAHLLPGGCLVMPFMFLWRDETPAHLAWSEWKLVAERERPDDGTTVRRHQHSMFDLERQLQHTEDRFELVRDGRVVHEELHRRSPATRWYTQQQAVDLYEDAGFRDARITRGFTEEPASPDDRMFSVFGTRP